MEDLHWRRFWYGTTIYILLCGGCGSFLFDEPPAKCRACGLGATLRVHREMNCSRVKANRGIQDLRNVAGGINKNLRSIGNKSMR